MKKILLLLPLILGLHLTTIAQDRALLYEELFESIGMKDRFSYIFNAAFKDIIKLDNNIPEEVLEEVYEQFYEQELKHWHKIIQGIYDKYYSEQELINVIDFYQTPTGKKVARLQPVIVSEAMEKGGEWGRTLTENLWEEFEKRGYLQEDSPVEEGDEVSIGQEFVETSVDTMPYFEGKITYIPKVSTINIDPDRDFYSNRYGDTIVTYLAANGDYRRIYLNSSSTGFKQIWFRGADKRIYFHTNYSDTLYYYPMDSQLDELQSFTPMDTIEIMGRQCPSIRVQAKEIMSGEFYESTYYYSDDLRLNHLQYKDFMDGFYNLMCARTKSMWLRYVGKFKTHIIDIRAVKIEEGKLDETIFELDKSLPIKSLL